MTESFHFLSRFNFSKRNDHFFAAAFFAGAVFAGDFFASAFFAGAFPASAFFAATTLGATVLATVFFAAADFTPTVRVTTDLTTTVVRLGGALRDVGAFAGADLAAPLRTGAGAGAAAASLRAGALAVDASFFAPPFFAGAAFNAVNRFAAAFGLAVRLGSGSGSA